MDVTLPHPNLLTPPDTLIQWCNEVLSLQPTLQTPSRRIISIQVCRGLAVLLVVFAHLHGIETKYNSTNHLNLFEHGALGVDLFFVISGIVIASVTDGKFARPDAARTFLYHRLARIFPIFWIYTTLTLIGRLIYSPPNTTLTHTYNIVASYLLIPTPRPMLLLQGWTLSYELYFYLAFFLLLLFSPQRLVPVLLTLWGIAIIALKLHIGLSPNPIVQLLISPSVLEFLAGCCLYSIYRRSRLHPSIGITLIILSLIELATIIATTPSETIITGPWLRPILYGSFATLFLLGALELERTGIIRHLPFLESLGDWSYSIYLSHALVLEFTARALTARTLSPLHPSIALISLTGIPLVILTGYLSYRYLEQPLLRRLYRLSPNPIKPAKSPA
jgi:exopolysaccharide production protein ExoZ